MSLQEGREHPEKGRAVLCPCARHVHRRQGGRGRPHGLSPQAQHECEGPWFCPSLRPICRGGLSPQGTGATAQGWTASEAMGRPGTWYQGLQEP